MDNRCASTVERERALNLDRRGDAAQLNELGVLVHDPNERLSQALTARLGSRIRTIVVAALRAGFVTTLT
jgi:hypothetical protein